MSEGTKRPTRRWDVDKQGCDYERADGMYVLYTDHVTELDALRAQLTERDARISELECQRDAAFAMSHCECQAEEACANLVRKDARIRELTEWRPMSEAPRDGRDILAMMPGGHDVIGWTGTAWTDGSKDYFQDSHFLGWLPLPEAKK